MRIEISDELAFHIVPAHTWLRTKAMKSTNVRLLTIMSINFASFLRLLPGR